MWPLVVGLFVTANGYRNDIFHHFPPALSSGGLSDEALSLQFTMSRETFLNKGVWSEEWGFQTTPSQEPFSSVRYQLAFLAYSAASTCQQPPAYRQVCAATLSDAIERMIDPKVWAKLVDERWGPDSYSRAECRTPNNPDSKWGAAATWPDPVAYQNIMYSGHVAQMMVLYEAVTGDDVYRTKGWTFTYNATIHFDYNLTQLLDGLALQMLNPNNAQVWCSLSTFLHPFHCTC